MALRLYEGGTAWLRDLLNKRVNGRPIVGQEGEQEPILLLPDIQPVLVVDPLNADEAQHEGPWQFNRVYDYVQNQANYTTQIKLPAAANGVEIEIRCMGTVINGPGRVVEDAAVLGNLGLRESYPGSAAAAQFTPLPARIHQDEGVLLFSTDPLVLPPNDPESTQYPERLLYLYVYGRNQAADDWNVNLAFSWRRVYNDTAYTPA